MLSWGHKHIGRAGGQPEQEQSRMLWDCICCFMQEDNACYLLVLFYIQPRLQHTESGKAQVLFL